jgi:2-dehydropantoate 2-reductase
VIQQQEYEDMQIGLFPNKERSIDESTSRLNAFAALLTEGGAKFQILEDIQVQRWEKVVWNAAWNSLTTLTMLDTCTWLDSSPHATPMTTTLMREVIDVARATGVALDYGLVGVLMKKILARPGIGSSMQTDAKEGRPLEAEVILGVPFQKSKALGLKTPTLDILYTLILAVDCRLRRGASA